MAVIYLPKDTRYSDMSESLNQGILTGVQIGMEKEKMNAKKAAGALATILEYGGDLSVSQASKLQKELGLGDDFFKSISERQNVQIKDSGHTAVNVPETSYNIESKGIRDIETQKQTALMESEVKDTLLPHTIARRKAITMAEGEIKEETKSKYFEKELDRARQIKDLEKKYKEDERTENYDDKMKLLKYGEEQANARAVIAAGGKGQLTTNQLLTHDRIVEKTTLEFVKPLIIEKGRPVVFDQDDEEFKDTVNLLKTAGVSYKIVKASRTTGKLDFAYDNVSIILVPTGGELVKNATERAKGSLTEPRTVTPGQDTKTPTGYTKDAKLQFGNSFVQGTWNEDRTAIHYQGKDYPVK